MPGLYTDQRIGSAEVYAGIGEGPVTHLVTGASSTQDNQTSTGAIRQTHRVVGANSQQANTASAGSITQSTTTFVAGSASQQANQCSAGAIRQVHLVSGANCQQVNAVSTGAVRLPGTASLTADDLQAIVSAVWGALATSHNTPGTFGQTNGATPEDVADAVLAAAQLAPIHADVRKSVGTSLHGDGSEANKFRSVLVP